MSEAFQTITGYHAICAALPSVAPQNPQATLYLHGQGARGEQLERLARIHKVTVRRVDRREIERIGGEKARGAVLVAVQAGPTVRTLNEAISAVRATHATVLVLDHLSDPHNLGAILRSADQFCVDFVVLPSRRAAGMTDAVLRASAGAASVVSTVEVPNIAAALEALKKAEFWIYGADMAGEPIDRQQLTGRVALVLGSEGEGLSRLVRDRCDTIVRIPTGGTVDSLNVSVSAGILLYEASRQQQRFREPS